MVNFVEANFIIMLPQKNKLQEKKINVVNNSLHDHLIQIKTIIEQINFIKNKRSFVESNSDVSKEEVNLKESK